VVHRALALGDGELPEEEERRPWLGGDPVRVASPGVEIGDALAVLTATFARSFLISNGLSVSY
jgi:hypothetical protein